MTRFNLVMTSETLVMPISSNDCPSETRDDHKPAGSWLRCTDVMRSSTERRSAHPYASKSSRQHNRVASCARRQNRRRDVRRIYIRPCQRQVDSIERARVFTQDSRAHPVRNRCRDKESSGCSANSKQKTPLPRSNTERGTRPTEWLGQCARSTHPSTCTTS